ncbi:MAG: hypothetical protein QOE84_1035 [Actinomycetota bacterium]|jgi:hypothetical protein|nr:hypothetical protein [Actinomycetota bacterium]
MPWRITELMRLYTANGVGVILLLVGWFGASGTVRGTTQVEWCALGLLGVIVAGTANGMWVMSGRRAVAERRAAAVTGVGWLVDALAVDGRTASEEDPAVGRRLELVGLPGSALVHRSGCQLVEGKADVIALEGAALTERRLCGVCEE